MSIAIVGDIINSTKIAKKGDWDEFFNTLQVTLNDINEEFKGDFFAKLVSTKGDEISGVLTNFDNIYPILKRIRDDIYPYKIRLVAVKDAIHVPIGEDKHDARTLSGPAFTKSSMYMENIKKKEEELLFAFGIELLDMALNILSKAIAKGYDKIGNRRNLKVYNYYYYKSKKQKEIAKKMEMSQQNVSYILEHIEAEYLFSYEKRFIEISKNYNSILEKNYEDIINVLNKETFKMNKKELEYYLNSIGWY